MKLMLLPPPWIEMSVSKFCRIPEPSHAYQDMCTRNNSTTAGKPFGRSRVIEACSLAIKLHVPWVDAWTVDLYQP